MGFITPLKKRSDKAKEEFAKSLLTVGSQIHGALIIALFVVPLSALTSAYLKSGKVQLPSLHQLNNFAAWYSTPLFIFIFHSTFVGIVFKNKALDILDELQKPYNNTLQ